MSRELRIDALNVRVAPDVDAMARDAAADAAAVLRAAIGARGEANVMLATGNSQLVFLAQLAATSGHRRAGAQRAAVHGCE